MRLVIMKQKPWAKFKPPLLQTHGLPPGFLNHLDTSESVPTLNATIEIKPHFQLESIFTKHTGNVVM